jgi:hypothetical protein
MKNQQLKRTTLNSWLKILTVTSVLFSSNSLMAQQVTTDQPTDNSPIQNSLPCTDSSPECVQQLTESAIVQGTRYANASSPELKLLGEKITIIEQQLELLGKRIEYSRKRSWTSYLTIDPVKLLQNIFGGGDVQRDKLAIADLQVKTAQLESALAEMERRKEEEKINLGDKVLRLVLDIESNERTIALIQSQQNTFALQNEVFRIQYRFGQGSTEQLLGMTTRSDRLNQQLTAAQIKRDGAVRELGQVTIFLTKSLGKNWQKCEGK